MKFQEVLSADLLLKLHKKMSSQESLVPHFLPFSFNEEGYFLALELISCIFTRWQNNSMSFLSTLLTHRILILHLVMIYLLALNYE